MFGKGLFFGFCLFFILGNVVFADQIYTQQGKRLTGIISEENEEYIILKTEAGTAIINRPDILHIERSEVEDMKLEKDTFYSKTVAFFESLPKNDWHVVRRQFKIIHGKIFSWLGRNSIYRYISSLDGVEKFRKENYKAYFFAVYMVLMIIITFIYAIIQNICIAIYCKMFGIKRRLDG